MKDTFVVHKGSTFSARFHWPDGAGGHLNLVGASVAIFDGQNVDGLTATIIEASTGLIELSLIAAHVALMPLGRIARFRVSVTFPDTTVQTTNLLWVDVQ